jgi:hypothetical protein
MTFIMSDDEVLSVAIAGVPKVAEFIAGVPMEHRSRALDAAEQSYLQTAHALGYQDVEAQQWVSAVMARLRLDESDYKLRMFVSPPTSPS